MNLLLLLSFAQAASISESLDTGDVAWCNGDIRLAKKSWAEATESAHPAAVAMAEFRMLQTSSNLGWTIHGIRGDKALEQCSAYDAWCGLAWVDREILLHQIGIPVNTDLMQQQLILIESELPAQVLARRVWMGDLQPEVLSGQELDGLGNCLSTSQWPSDNPRPYVGLGLTGGAMLGIGGVIQMSYPFTKSNFVQGSLSYTTKHAGHFSVLGAWGSEWGGMTDIQLSRQPYFEYQDQNFVDYTMITTGSISGGPKLKGDTFQALLGATVRSDNADDQNGTYRGHGPIFRASWRPHSDVKLHYRTEATWLDYTYWRNDLSASWLHHTGLAIQLNLQTAMGNAIPWWRFPTAGGGQMMRTPKAQQIRAPFLPIAISEWRLRPEKMLGLSLFAESSYGDQFHWGTGMGVRFRLPPQPHNTIRFDIGYGDLGVGFSVGMGEFF